MFIMRTYGLLHLCSYTAYLRHFSHKLANVATSSIYLLREGAQEPLNQHYWIHDRWNHTLSTPCYTNMTVSVCKQGRDLIFHPGPDYSKSAQPQHVQIHNCLHTHRGRHTSTHTQSHTWWFVDLKILPRQPNCFIGGMTNDALPLRSA